MIKAFIEERDDKKTANLWRDAESQLAEKTSEHYVSRRRRKAEGVRKRGTRFQASVYLGCQDGKLKYITRSFATENEAKEWRSKTLTERNTGGLVVPTKVTVAEFIDEWVAKYAAVPSIGGLSGDPNRP